jgi:hypothetical protein
VVKSSSRARSRSRRVRFCDVGLFFTFWMVLQPYRSGKSTDAIRWDEKAGLRRDAIRSQVIDALEAQEIKETGNEED